MPTDSRSYLSESLELSSRRDLRTAPVFRFAKCFQVSGYAALLLQPCEKQVSCGIGMDKYHLHHNNLVLICHKVNQI